MQPIAKTLLTFIVLAIYGTTLSAQAEADDFTIIKQRVVAELMKSSVDDARVEDILNRMQEDGSYPEIDYSDLSRTAGFPHRHHERRP